MSLSTLQIYYYLAIHEKRYWKLTMYISFISFYEPSKHDGAVPPRIFLEHLPCSLHYFFLVPCYKAILGNSNELLGHGVFDELPEGEPSVLGVVVEGTSQCFLE